MILNWNKKKAEKNEFFIKSNSVVSLQFVALKELITSLMYEIEKQEKISLSLLEPANCLDSIFSFNRLQTNKNVNI